MKIVRVGFFRELRHGDPAGPSLAAERGTLGEQDRKRVSAYLKGGSVLATTGRMVSDWFNPSHTNVAPLESRTDGRWIWPGDLSYYVENYGVGIPMEMMADMAVHGWKAPELTAEQLLAVEEEMFGQ